MSIIFLEKQRAFFQILNLDLGTSLNEDGDEQGVLFPKWGTRFTFSDMFLDGEVQEEALPLGWIKEALCLQW